jgi:hypothetical protein
MTCMTIWQGRGARPPMSRQPVTHPTNPQLQSQRGRLRRRCQVTRLITVLRAGRGPPAIAALQTMAASSAACTATRASLAMMNAGARYVRGAVGIAVSDLAWIEIPWR